nr:MAG TPA: hypothetical protein [Herelleviridae sp.]
MLKFIIISNKGDFTLIGTRLEYNKRLLLVSKKRLLV